MNPPGSSDMKRPICGDRKSTRLNSSHLVISYAVFCLKKKKTSVHTRTIRLTLILLVPCSNISIASLLATRITPQQFGLGYQDARDNTHTPSVDQFRLD